MADVHSIKIRSYNMSQIKGKDTKPELLVRSYLHKHGFRYRLHYKKLPGKPDIVLKKYNTIIDVRGCFWHLHKYCKYGDQVITPSRKVTSNRKSAAERDIANLSQWKAKGWKIHIIWSECELEPKKRYSKKREDTLNKLLSSLKA